MREYTFRIGIRPVSEIHPKRTCSLCPSTLFLSHFPQKQDSVFSSLSHFPRLCPTFKTRWESNNVIRRFSGRTNSSISLFYNENCLCPLFKIVWDKDLTSAWPTTTLDICIALMRGDIMHKQQTTITPPPILRPRRELFQPAPRGDISRALATKHSGRGKFDMKTGRIDVIAPESPRPSEMLDGVSVTSRDELTADDAALHELLVSKAYADDRPLTGETHFILMSEAIRYLGERVERSDVRACLNRLKRTTVSYGLAGGRRYEDVQLLQSWIEVDGEKDVIKFSLPEPLRELMRRQPTYAYIELAALPAMRSKFSARLYRRLALAASKEKWVPGRENVVEVYATTDELAHWIGWPRQKDGSVHSGKLRDRFLKRIDDDFASVRAFALECEEDRASTRGRPLLGITFRLRLQPPSRHTVRVPAVVQRGEFRPGFKDEPRYCVEDRTWRAAAKKFREQLPTSPKGLSDLWKVALQEALDGIQHTDGYANRQFRGERLLAAIDARGADYAAWSFLAEEAESPDLWSMPLQERAKAEYSADEARKERIGWKKPRSSEITAPAAHPETETANPDFETCTHIVLTANPALNSIEVGRLGDKIKSMKPDFTGGRVITLTIRFQVGTAYDRWNVGYFSLSEDDLDVILTKFRGEFDPNSVAEFEIMCDEDMRRPDGNVEIHLLHGRVRRRGYQLDHESRLIEEYRSRPAPAEDVRRALGSCSSLKPWRKRPV